MRNGRKDIGAGSDRSISGTSDFRGKKSGTVEKYLRDIRAFAVYMRGKVVRKAAVIDYKKLLQKKYAVRSVNSTLASINGLFSFLGWHELRVKTVKLQRQVFSRRKRS